MPIKNYIIDGKGSGRKAFVDDDNALLTTEVPYPPNIRQKIKPFIQYMTDDGTATGSEDMQLAAIDTPKSFWIPADGNNDRYITKLSFVIADAGAQLNEFGSVTALTTGCKLYYLDHDLTEIVIQEGLKANWDFVRMCAGNPAFGTGADAFRGRNVSGSSEAYIPILELGELIPPFGIKLDAGTNSKIIFTVNDRTDQVDQFDCIAYGFDRILD